MDTYRCDALFIGEARTSTPSTYFESKVFGGLTAAAAMRHLLSAV